MGTKTILFHPMNSAGHIHALLAIADRLKSDHGARTVFVVIGPTTKSIEQHGHEVIVLDEPEPYEDYEISDLDDDSTKSSDEESMKRQFRVKKKYPGISKWPHSLRRVQPLLDQDSPIQIVENLFKQVVKITQSETIATDELLDSTIESIKPDLIVVDAFMAPACVVKREKACPWIRLHSANPLSMMEAVQVDEVAPAPHCGFSLLDKNERNRLRSNESEKWRAIIDEWKQARERILKTVSEFPVAPMRDLFEQQGCLERFTPVNMMSLYVNVYMFPQALDYDRDDDLIKYPPKCLRCDSLMRKPIDQTTTNEEIFWARELKLKLKSSHEDGIIYLSLGSVVCGMFNLLQRLINFLYDDDRHLYVISLGPYANRLKLNPSNMVGAEYLPQLFLLQQAKLAIVHGGNNTITECMYYGVPMVVLPFFGDQFDNAQRVEDLGFGRRLNPFRCTKEQLRLAINTLERDPSISDQMNSISKRMQSTDDTAMIASLIIKLAEDKCSSRKYTQLDV